VCGIVGLFSFRGPAPRRESWPDLVNHLRHRGPDEGGTWARGPFFLGHRRLSIIDLASGGQPMTTAEGDLAITFNGEIYNHQELRGELEAAGHKFRTTKQAACLVQVAVVRPAVEGREALLARTAAATAVADAVRARAVPCHTDHERAVVAEVGGPPVLGVREHVRDVPLHGGQIEGLERLGVVELLVHGVGHGRVLGEDLQVEAVRPPAAVPTALRRVRGAAVHDRAATSGLRARRFDDCIVVLRHGNSFHVDQG
jgi:hypothetical protein